MTAQQIGGAVCLVVAVCVLAFLLITLRTPKGTP